MLSSFIYTCNYTHITYLSLYSFCSYPSIKMKTIFSKHFLPQYSIPLTRSRYSLSSLNSFPGIFSLPLEQIFFLCFLDLIPHMTSQTQHKNKNNIQLTAPDLAMISSIVYNISICIQNKFISITRQFIKFEALYKVLAVISHSTCLSDIIEKTPPFFIMEIKYITTSGHFIFLCHCFFQNPLSIWTVTTLIT